MSPVHQGASGIQYKHIGCRNRNCGLGLALLYPTVRSLLAFGVPFWVSDGSWRGALGVARRQIAAKWTREAVPLGWLAKMAVSGPAKI